MSNRNTGYVKRGTIIDIQIRDEYYVSASIKPINYDKTEFKCELSIHNIDVGMTIELDKSTTISSTYRTVNKDIAAKLNEMIDNGYFDEDVDNVKNMVECLNALLEFQRKINQEK